MDTTNGALGRPLNWLPAGLTSLLLSLEKAEYLSLQLKAFSVTQAVKSLLSINAPHRDQWGKPNPNPSGRNVFKRISSLDDIVSVALRDLSKSPANIHGLSIYPSTAHPSWLCSCDCEEDCDCNHTCGGCCDPDCTSCEPYNSDEEFNCEYVEPQYLNFQADYQYQWRFPLAGSLMLNGPGPHSPTCLNGVFQARRDSRSQSFEGKEWGWGHRPEGVIWSERKVPYEVRESVQRASDNVGPLFGGWMREGEENLRETDSDNLEVPNRPSGQDGTVYVSNRDSKEDNSAPIQRRRHQMQSSGNESEKDNAPSTKLRIERAGGGANRVTDQPAGLMQYSKRDSSQSLGTGVQVTDLWQPGKINSVINKFLSPALKILSETDTKKEVKDLSKLVSNQKPTQSGGVNLYGQAIAAVEDKETDARTLDSGRTGASPENQCDTKKWNFRMGQNAVAGALAGAFVSLFLHPVDTVKTVVQAQTGQNRNLIPILSSIISQRGMRGLYRGLGSNLASSAPTSAIYTLTYEAVKAGLLPHLPEDMSALAHCTAGGCASIATSIVYTPSECVKQQMQVGSLYRNSWLAFTGLLKQGGLPMLYNGWGAVLCRNVPQSVIKFYTYEGLKLWALSGQPTGTPLSTIQTLAIGGVAGSTAAFFTTPFDVVKTRLQTQFMASARNIMAELTSYFRKNDTNSIPGSVQHYNGVFHAFQCITAREGVAGLYRGLVPRLMIYVTQGALFFASYEFIKHVLAVEVPRLRIKSSHAGDLSRGPAPMPAESS